MTPCIPPKFAHANESIFLYFLEYEIIILLDLFNIFKILRIALKHCIIHSKKFFVRYLFSDAEMT